MTRNKNRKRKQKQINENTIPISDKTNTTSDKKKQIIEQKEDIDKQSVQHPGQIIGQHITLIPDTMYRILEQQYTKLLEQYKLLAIEKEELQKEYNSHVSDFAKVKKEFEVLYDLNKFLSEKNRTHEEAIEKLTKESIDLEKLVLKLMKENIDLRQLISELKSDNNEKIDEIKILKSDVKILKQKEDDRNNRMMVGEAIMIYENSFIDEIFSDPRRRRNCKFAHLVYDEIDKMSDEECRQWKEIKHTIQKKCSMIVDDVNWYLASYKKERNNIAHDSCVSDDTTIDMLRKI